MAVAASRQRQLSGSNGQVATVTAKVMAVAAVATVVAKATAEGNG